MDRARDDAWERRRRACVRALAAWLATSEGAKGALRLEWHSTEEDLRVDDDDDDDSSRDVRIWARAEGYADVYVELMMRVCEARREGGAMRRRRPFVMGVSAPQGCGKTTTTGVLVDMIRATPRAWVCGGEDVGDDDDDREDRVDGTLNATALSIDDFYLRGEDQDALAAAKPANAMLRHRGNAGTHDLELGRRTLDALARINDDDANQASSVRVPRYDKTARQGWGDRTPEDAWDVVSAPLDVVLLEGWMLGFSPIDDDEALININNDLVDVNAYLREYGPAWWSPGSVDWWVVFKVSDPSWVYAWRLEAERKANGNKGLTDEQVKDFVDRFMPAYQAYLPKLYDAPPTPAYVIPVSKDRAFGRAATVDNKHN